MTSPILSLAGWSNLSIESWGSVSFADEREMGTARATTKVVLSLCVLEEFNFLASVDVSFLPFLIPFATFSLCELLMLLSCYPPLLLFARRL